jgi:2-iminoacetate synthase
MNTFKSVFEHYNWDDIQSKIYATTTKQVEQALAKTKEMDDFLVLISQPNPILSKWHKNAMN